MSLEFRRGGRRVSQDDFVKGLEQDVLDLASNEIEARVRRTRCPIHGSTPTSVRRTGTPRSPSWQVEGCCDALSAAIKAEFG